MPKTIATKRFTLNETGEKVAVSRYYQKNEKGEIIEDWDGLVNRVVKHVCKNEPSDYQEKMVEIIGSTKFLPNSPCLVNAGRKINKAGLMACYVSKAPEDTWASMCDTIKNFGDVARAGGGCGLFLGNIRPEGSPVFGSTHSKACGPIEHMRMISEVMSSITQAGFRGMALMSSINVDHPDVLNFIKCKQTARALKTFLKEDIFHHYDKIIDNVEPQLKIVLDKFLSNFNISVLTNDKFMNAVEKDLEWELSFAGKTYQKLKAKDIFNLIAENAWKNGDPGLFFGDTINNTTPYRFSGQKIETSNPCCAKGTLVDTPKGQRKVEHIKVGDIINTLHPDGYEPVTSIEKHKNEKVFKVRFSDCGFQIVTASHRYFSIKKKDKTKEFRTYRLDELKVNDFIMTLNNGVSDKVVITDISEFGYADVYDLYCEESDSWITSGYVQLGCGEQILPSSNSNCNLGSIDVSKFYNVASKDVNWLELQNVIELSFQFLDNVIDVHDFPAESFKQWGMDNRPVGLGIMGFADLLLKLKIKYGSKESIVFGEKLMKFFADISHNKSVSLAKERGTPKCCNYKELEFRRNVTTTSIAPTGSISLLAGCSSSIEPIFSAIMFRHDNTGTYEIKHPDADSEYFACALDGDGGPKEVKYQEHIYMQAAFQKFCDSGISKCISGNSLILTKNGLIRIKDINNSRVVDGFAKIESRVFSENTFEVVDQFYYGGLKETIKIETQMGLIIEGTPNHKIKVMINDGLIDWKRLDEITKDDYCACLFNTQIYGDIIDLPSFETKNYGNSTPILIPKKLNKRLSYLIGLITAEGNYGGENSVVITHTDTKFLSEANEIFNEEFGLVGRIELDIRTESVYKLIVHSRNLVRWMQTVSEIHRGAANKIIPSIILKTTKENIYSFLSGLYFDGYVNVTEKGTKLGICLASESIIRDLQILLLNMGIASNIIKKYNKIYDRYYHEILIYGNGLEKMKSILEFRELWKKDALNAFITNKPNEYYLGCPSIVTSFIRNGVLESQKTMYSFIKETNNFRIKNAIMRNGEMKREDIISAVSYFNIESNECKNVINSFQTFENCIFQKVVNISLSKSEVFDLYVPSNNTFYANGLINHNTINAPSSTTIEDVKNAYMLAWKHKCKGITFYRNNSKTTQVLNQTNKVTVKKIDQKVERPSELPCDIFSIKADGRDWHIIIGLKDGNPYELFAVNGSKFLPEKGSIVKVKKRHYSLLDDKREVLLENIIKSEDKIDPKVGLETRRFSLELRHGIPAKFIVDQIDKSSDVITSFSKAAARIFKKKYLEEGTISGVLCPECLKKGVESKMVFASSCNTCPTCSFSRCG